MSFLRTSPLKKPRTECGCQPVLAMMSSMLAPDCRRSIWITRFCLRAVRTLQKFAAAHASIHNHFNHDRHLNRRDIFKQNRSAALVEWRQLAA